MSAPAMHTSVPQYVVRPGALSPIVLTDRELLNETHALIQRIAHSSLPARDAMLFAELTVRFARSA